MTGGAHVDEVQIENVVWSYDGRVLELFGAMGQGSVRFHRAVMSMEIAGPNRKGKRSVQVRGPSAVLLTISEADWPVIEPLLRRVESDIA